jgi:prepilin-type N-terminal cleavage/methylation domain-containing protein
MKKEEKDMLKTTRNAKGFTLIELLMVLVIMIIVFIAAGSALAATVTSTFNVTATVISNCRISTAASNIAFTSYDPTDSSPNDTGTGSFGFRCTKGTSYKLYITGTRSMTGAGGTLPFELYTNAGRSTLYPSSSGGASSVASTGNAAVTSNIYGRIPAEADVGAGSDYTVTLTATVEY